jgi:hypothetical protein
MFKKPLADLKTSGNKVRDLCTIYLAYYTQRRFEILTVES